MSDPPLSPLPPLPVARPLGKAVALAFIHFVFVFALLMVPLHFAFVRGDVGQLLARIVRLLMCASCTYIFFIKVCNFQPRDIGLALPRNSATRFLAGIGIGVLCLLVCFCIAWGKGALVVSAAPPDETPTTRDWLLRGGAMLVGATFEEFAFRVAMVGVLSRVLPVSLSISLPAALFGLLHALNPGATTLAVLNTSLAGLLLGYLFFDRGASSPATGPSLPLATGFHFSWNLLMGYFFGIPVSGHPSSARILRTEPTDILWSGGSYGLEAGIAATIVLAGASVAAFYYARPRLRSAMSIDDR